MNFDTIIEKASRKVCLTKDEAVLLLSARNNSKQFYDLISLAGRLTREEYQNKGYVYAQIGINSEPCSKNCKFCSMGSKHFSVEDQYRKTMDDVISEVNSLVNAGIDALFLMTTADYPIKEYLKIIKNVKPMLKDRVDLVANIGDFDISTAKALKNAGVNGVYHILRLREGIDTDISPVERIETLKNITDAGLQLFYCIEPIGPEHTYREIADEMIRARELGVEVMAVMRRIPVKGTPLYEKGCISKVELSKIAAVTRLVSRPSRAMNAHETIEMGLIAGVNQLYAEMGSNPRDSFAETLRNRGKSVKELRTLLREAEYTIS